MEKIRRVFDRWASPASLLVGVLIGFTHVWLVYGGVADPGATRDARVLLAFLFITGGAMGTFYFEKRAFEELRLPYIIEILRFFFILWTIFGVLWIVRIFGDDPPPQEDWALYAITFFTGWIAGTVWTMALILVSGIRYDVGQWQVIRFPAWIALGAYAAYRFAAGLMRRKP